MQLSLVVRSVTSWVKTTTSSWMQAVTFITRGQEVDCRFVFHVANRLEFPAGEAPVALNAALPS
jgi:hypothetical protein